MPDFGLIWRLFANISKSTIFFKNPALRLFYHYSPLTSCKKSENSLELFLWKLRYQTSNEPTNQPINYFQQHRSYRTSLTPVQKQLIFYRDVHVKPKITDKLWLVSLNNTLLYSPSKHNLFPIYSPVKLEKAQVFHKNGCTVKIFRDSNF